MRILGIDTATSIASVALVEDGALIAEELHDRRRATSEAATVQLGANHAEFVLSAIQSLLHRTNTAFIDLSGIAVTAGPGSFTGLRIGLATVKGLAYNSGIPVVGASTLYAYAARVKNFAGFIGVLLDARKNEVYFALFRCDGDEVRRVTEDAVSSVKSVIELLQKFAAGQSEPALLIGDGAIAYKAKLVDSFGASVAISDGIEYGSVAAQVARLAEQRFRCGSIDDIGALAPVYLCLPEAESRLRLSMLTS